MEHLNRQKLEKLKSCIRSIADELGVDPYLVTLKQYRSATVDKPMPLNWRQIAKYGGWDAIRDQVFPPKEHENPFSDDLMKSLGQYEISEHIANVIRDCAKAYGFEPSDVHWHEFKRYIELCYGHNVAGIASNWITDTGSFNAIRDTYFKPQSTKVAVEKIRVRQTAKLNRRLRDEEGEMEFILGRAMDELREVFTSREVIYKCAHNYKDNGGEKRILTLMISDTHIGADIKGEETGFEDFGLLEESRRLARITKEVIEYHPEHRANTSLYIVLIGDIIQGDLQHDPRDGAILSDQLIRGMWLLPQMVNTLAAHFPAGVKVFRTYGNHGRIISRHRGRAINQKYDSLERVLYYGVRQGSNKDIEFISSKTPWVDVDYFGTRAMFTHGDTFFSAGMPSKSLPVSSIEEQINRYNAKLPDTKEYQILGMGHVHICCQVFLHNGCNLLVNSSLSPVDPYAVSLGHIESVQGQWLFESTESNPHGDMRFIRVGRRDDTDESLDQIIRPYNGTD